MQKAPISVCMMVRDEEVQIEACIKSFIDYVEELVIVDTGSSDKTPEICKKYTDKFYTYTDCNDSEGRINDFSEARNKSFSYATKPYILWVDGDDEVQNAQNLPQIIENNKVV